MLYLIGNGPSRKDFDWDSFLEEGHEWWGFNGIYQQQKPDLLFALDIPVQRQVIDDMYHYENKVAVGDFDPIPMEMWDLMTNGFEYSHQPQNIFKVRKDGDDLFTIQGFDDVVSCIGYSSVHKDNIVIYNNPKLKNLFGGMSALGYAAEHKYTDICLIGFDALEHADPTSIYSGDYLNYQDEYTEESRVFHTQQQQFLALLKEYENINVYWKKPLDGLVKVDYNVLNYENSEEWILGVGHLSEVSL